MFTGITDLAEARHTLKGRVAVDQAAPDADRVDQDAGQADMDTVPVDQVMVVATDMAGINIYDEIANGLPTRTAIIPYKKTRLNF